MRRHGGFKIAVIFHAMNQATAQQHNAISDDLRRVRGGVGG